MWLCVFFRAFVKCTFLCHSGIPADPLFHILWWKSWICMWKDIFSYKTIINQIDAHWIKRVLFSQLRSIMMICLLSVLFGLLETRSGGGSGGSCPVPSRELESQGLMLSHIQEERRRPRRCVSSARVSCVILFVTLSARLMAAGLPLLTGGTSQSVRLEITLTPREIHVCSTSHGFKKQQEPVWCYKHSCSHSRLVRNPVERSECPQSCFRSFAWRTNMKQWGGRMFSFHEFDKFGEKKKNPVPGEARRWEWEGSCSCVYNEVTADVSESHKQSLGRQLVATG